MLKVAWYAAMAAAAIAGGTSLVAEGIMKTDAMPVAVGGFGLMVGLGYLLLAVEAWRWR